MENNTRSRCLFVALTALLTTVVVAGSARADTINLAWNPVSDTTVVGYMVHVGTQSGSYTQHLDVGLTSAYGWSSATAGQRYCFAVSAYIASHLEGPKSNEVCGYSNAPPVLTNPGNRSSVVGQATSLQLQATDPDGQPVSYVASGMPPGLSLMVGTGFISGTPTTVGAYNVTATASDGVLKSSQAFTWTITASTGDTSSPTVTITAPTSASTYSTGSSTIALSGTASDNVGVTQVTWVSDRGGSGTASGTTSWNSGSIALTAGTNVITVTARDGAGNTAIDAVTVTYTATTSGGTTGGTTTGGSGLRGDYYSGMAFGSLLTTRVDPTVNFDWASGTPGTNLPADSFSVRWTGDVMAPTTGTYTFTTASDDGVRLWVNNQLVINNWTDHAVVSNTSAGVTLTAGQRYAVKLEYYENAGLSTIKLQWTPPGQATQVIPQSALFSTSGSTSSGGTTSGGTTGGGTTSGGTTVDTTTGLVAAYSFNAGSGTTVADSSGRGNNGVANSTATWSTGKFGNAMRFNGVDALVTVPDSASLDLTTAMTLEAWVKPAVIPVGWRTVLHKNVDPYFLMASDPNGKPAGGGNFTNGTPAYGVGPSALAVNTWTHLAATFDGSIVRLYVNGALVSSQSQTAPLLTSSGTLQMGGGFYGEFFNGWIDEIRIYNRALSSAEIQSTMNAPLP